MEHAIQLSIVMVAYRNMDVLGRALASIPELSWLEVIVVNNTRHNRGFGAATNVGVQLAKGKYVLCLNPDCIVSEEALVGLLETVKRDQTIGVAGPRLVDLDGKEYLSCSQQPTRQNMPVVYSILNRWLASSELVQRHWYGHHVPKDAQEVGVVTGAALLMPREVYLKVGGFD